MQPKLSFFFASGATFARIESDTRDMTIAVDSHDEQDVRQAAADFRARAARLIERAAFIESALATTAADYGETATPWVAVPHPMLAGVSAVKRTVTQIDATQRVEYVGFLDKPTTNPDKAVNFAYQPNAITKAAWLNAESNAARRDGVADLIEYKTLRATA